MLYRLDAIIHHPHILQNSTQPSTLCLHTLSGASDTATGTIELQCEKLAILKAAALKNKQNVFLNKNRAVDSLRDREEYKELFKDTEVPAAQ